MYLFLYFILSLLEWKQMVSFPQSDNPITESPALIRPSSSEPSCTVTVFDEAACDSWNLVLQSTIALPTTDLCSNMTYSNSNGNAHGTWNRIIMDISVTENGTQFDRYGAMWINGVEILRTTTAEPTSEGIAWTIEKDLTTYSSMFADTTSESAPLVATLSIPNNIDDTYTGVPLVTTTIPIPRMTLTTQRLRSWPSPTPPVTGSR